MGNLVISKSNLEFLKTLKKNNNREWFNNHKAQHDEYVKEPTLDFSK